MRPWDFFDTNGWFCGISKLSWLFLAYLEILPAGLEESLKRLKTNYSCYQLASETGVNLFNKSTWASYLILVEKERDIRASKEK